MEKRIGSALIIVADKLNADRINQVLSKHATIILGRMGLPAREREVAIISIVFEGTTDEIGALTGQLGRIEGVIVKSLVIKS
jgi:putative iron-only hydrogenase system regulator